MRMKDANHNYIQNMFLSQNFVQVYVLKHYILSFCSSSMVSVSPTHAIFVPVVCLSVNKSGSCKLVVGLGGKEQWCLPIIIQSIYIGIISQ